MKKLLSLWTTEGMINKNKIKIFGTWKQQPFSEWLGFRYEKKIMFVALNIDNTQNSDLKPVGYKKYKDNSVIVRFCICVKNLHFGCMSV